MRCLVLIAVLAGCCHPAPPTPPVKPEAVRLLPGSCAEPLRDPPPLPAIRTVERVVEGYRAEHKARIYNEAALRECAARLREAIDQFAIIFPEQPDKPEGAKP